MKTLFLLASMMVVLFLGVPNSVEAQKRKATKIKSAIIKEITTNKGKFPIIELTDRNKADAINSYISTKVFGKAYGPTDIKSFIEIEGWDKNNYSNYSEVGYQVKNNTSSKLIVSISACVMGASEHCAKFNFEINPITGSKRVKIVQ